MSSSTSRKMYFEEFSYRSVRSRSKPIEEEVLYSFDLEYLQGILLVSIILSICSSYLSSIFINNHIVCDGTVGTLISHGSLLSEYFIDFLFGFGFYSIPFATYFPMDVVKSFEYINAMIMSLTCSFFLSF